MNTIEVKTITETVRNIRISSIIILTFTLASFFVSIIFNIGILFVLSLSFIFSWGVFEIGELLGRHSKRKNRKHFEQKNTTRSEVEPAYEFTKNDTKYRVKRYKRMINYGVGYKTKKYLGLEEKDNNEWNLVSEEEYNGQNPKSWGDNEVMYH